MLEEITCKRLVLQYLYDFLPDVLCTFVNSYSYFKFQLAKVECFTHILHLIYNLVELVQF